MADVDVIMVPVQRTVFDLDTFTEVTLRKETPFQPVKSQEEAVERLGGDSTKLLALLNEGLRAEVRRNAGAEPSGWHTLTDEGEMNGEFSGTVADAKKVNALVLTLAKTVFGYNKDMKKEEKKAAKEAAENMIRTNEAIRNGLKKSAALEAEEE